VFIACGGSVVYQSENDAGEEPCGKRFSFLDFWVSEIEHVVTCGHDVFVHYGDGFAHSTSHAFDVVVTVQNEAYVS